MTALSIISFVLSSESTTCLESFPIPEILYDLYDCLIILNDWNPYFTQDCRQLATGYEVQYYLRGSSSESDGELFENQTNSVNNTLPEKIPGVSECSMSTNCYVRMKFWLNSVTVMSSSQWSNYSMWTTLSDNYKATQG